MSPWFGLVVGILATWRLSHLVACEDGPLDVVIRARRWAGAGITGRVMDCPYCLSLWIAMPIAAWLASGAVEAVLLWLAISGGASLAQRATAMAREPQFLDLEGVAAAREEQR